MNNYNNDYVWFFIITSLINTNLGLYNTSKNTEQNIQNKEMLDKLDKIMEKLKIE